MKILSLIGAIALLAVGFACTADDPSGSQLNSWDDVRTDWGDSIQYDASSPKANDAMAFYAAYVGSNSSASVGHFDITLDDVTVNSDGTQTWTYAITKTLDGPGYADLSHWDLILPNCDASNYTDLHGAGYGTDGAAASCAGSGDVVKWDWGFSYGTVEYYSITTDQEYNAAPMTFVLKFGTDCSTGTIAGPDCTDPGDGGGDDDGDGCPDWLDTLTLNASIVYNGHHGYTGAGLPIYYLGDTMQGDLTICNPTTDYIDNLEITAIQESYPSGSSILCGTPVEVWTSVDINPSDCITLSNTFYIDPACPWGNYQTHVIITRNGDENCPTAALIFDDGQVGVYDPPAGS